MLTPTARADPCWCQRSRALPDGHLMWIARRVRARTPACQAGKCFLVGSGPGSSVELMTVRTIVSMCTVPFPRHTLYEKRGSFGTLQVKSLALLEETDCVVYDDLASLDGLARCRPGTEVIYVGKRGGKASPKQDEICKILVEKCREYNHVRSLSLRSSSLKGHTQCGARVPRPARYVFACPQQHQCRTTVEFQPKVPQTAVAKATGNAGSTAEGRLRNSLLTGQ
jgi:hypothetical protein